MSLRILFKLYHFKQRKRVWNAFVFFLYVYVLHVLLFRCKTESWVTSNFLTDLLPDIFGAYFLVFAVAPKQFLWSLHQLHESGLACLETLLKRLIKIKLKKSALVGSLSKMARNYKTSVKLVSGINGIFSWNIQIVS